MLVKHEPAPLRKLWPWAAAAAVLAGLYLAGIALVQTGFFSGSMADKYITENFQNLPVTMDSRQDSLQTGVATIQ